MNDKRKVSKWNMIQGSLPQDQKYSLFDQPKIMHISSNNLKKEDVEKYV